MKFTTVWFLKNEITSKSQFLTATVNKADLLFSYIYEHTTFNFKETCFLGNQWKIGEHNLNSKLSGIFSLLSNTDLILYSW